MRTWIASCLVATAGAALAVQVRAGDSAPVTVMLRPSAETRYADVVKIRKALEGAQVGRIELRIAGEKASGVSAVIRARSDTPSRVVIRALKALQGAGVRKVTLDPGP